MNLEGAYRLASPIFATQIKEGKPCTINNDGEQLRDFTFVDDVIEVCKYGDAQTRKMLSDQLKENLAKARREVTIDLGKKYRGVDEVFNDLVSTEGKTGLELAKAQTTDRIIRNVIYDNVDESLKLIKQKYDWISCSPFLNFLFIHKDRLIFE